MITYKKLQEILNYDLITGIFTWKKSGKGIKHGVDSVAGSKTYDGYIAIRTGGKVYLAHRLAWLYVHGVWPNGGLDHKNTNKIDNSIDNLREATPTQNHQNSKAYKNNKLGIKGIRETPSGKFQVIIKAPDKYLCLGTFATLEEAKKEYENAAKEIHGEFVHFSIGGWGLKWD